MDKKTIIAFALIVVIFIAWVMYSSVHQAGTEQPGQSKPQQTTNTTNSQKKDSATNDANHNSDKLTENVAPSSNSLNADSIANQKISNKYGVFAPFTKGEQEYITIENKLYRAIISNKGASILVWRLKDYKMWNGYPTQLINSEKGELFMLFTSNQSKNIDTRDLFFEFENNPKYNYTLDEKDSVVLLAKLKFGSDTCIAKRFVFYGNSYTVKTDITFKNMSFILPSAGYDFVWTDGLRYQEQSSVDESETAEAFAVLNGSSPEKLNAGDDPPTKKATGVIDYVATKSKYFGTAIIPQPFRSYDGTIEMSSQKIHVGSDGIVEKYNIYFRVPLKEDVQTNSFLVYIGPLKYSILEKYGLQEMIDFGWKLVVRPIGEYFILPIILFLNRFIANYGIGLIIFSIIMKFILYPFSISQLKSAQKMKLLAPEMAKLREKYPDDQPKQQKETMKLYSEYGINPMGGCLPLLLQMPILYALWAVLRSSIDLRQADFFLWITDLSRPDVIFNMPVPLFGIKHFSGLALLMGIAMFFQQKMTVTDPKQKAMVWMMPIMFTIMFANFPSGLNLYYFMFNIMSIVQQIYMDKFSRNKPTLEQLRKAPKKEGWLQKKMREAQDIAESQGKTLPGKPINKPNNKEIKNTPKKKK